LKIVNGKSNYIICQNIGYIINEELNNEFINYFKDKIVLDERVIIKKLTRHITDEEIMYNLSQVTSIAFGLTEDCNFRCNYCIYSGIYKDERVHGEQKLGLKEAAKAIDFFMNLITQPFRRTRSNDFSIGFYGGEPLLELQLIKEIIAYVDSQTKRIPSFKDLNIKYRMTTNGYLLNGETIDYLYKKGISLDISLDGPEKEHNKFRKLKDGSETWKDVFKNIKYIKENYPEYYKKNINFLPTVHPQHNELKIVEFFKQNKDLFDINKIRFGNVNLVGLNPNLKENWVKNLGESSDVILEKKVNSSIHDKFFLKNLSRQSKFTATCFPGSHRVFINQKGDFNVCERINNNFSIGNVHRGFDFENIRTLISEYNKEIIRLKCWECPLWFLCSICFVHAAHDKRISIDCESIKRQLQSFLLLDLKNKEEDYYKRNNAFCGSVEEYLDCL